VSLRHLKRHCAAHPQLPVTLRDEPPSDQGGNADDWQGEMLSPASSAAPESEQHGKGNDCVSEHEGAGAVVYIVPFQGELPRGEHSTYSFDASSAEIGVI
jgi:hypothetical protein